MNIQHMKLLPGSGVFDTARIGQYLRSQPHVRPTPGRDDQFGAGLIRPRTALFGFGIRK